MTDADRKERTLTYGKLTVGRPRTDRPGEYHGTVEPPPDYLTDEQLAAFNETRPDRYEASEGQTLEQARNLSIRTFQDTCQFEGVGVPAPEDVLAEMKLRRGEKLPERIPLVVSEVPETVVDMTEADLDAWADTVAEGMAERHAKLTDDSAE